jgi:predicted O-methyltransferase YrrM
VKPPPLVARAQALAARLGFDRSCLDEDGALLHVLAGRRGILRAGEIGTGTGVGAAWIVSALEPGTPFVTVEIDPERAAAAAELFADDPHVRVLAGDWRAVLPAEAPFDLLFVDGADAKDDVDSVLQLLVPRGTVVLDDFRFDPAHPDPCRAAWLDHPELSATELWVARERRAIVAVRRA